MSGIQVMDVHLGAIALHGLRPQSRATHELRNAAPADVPPQRLEGMMDPRTSVAGVMEREQPHDLLREESVLFRVRTFLASEPGVEAAGRHEIAPTQRRYTESRALRVDEGERVAFRAEQNRMAFFRRSCSSCKSACACSSACSCAISRAGPSGGALGARPRSRPSRASFRHFDSMKGWISNAVATVFTCSPGC